MRTLLAVAVVALLGACTSLPERADPQSDAPDGRAPSAAGFVAPPSYDAALQTWRGADDVNAWIGARFEYDRAAYKIFPLTAISILPGIFTNATVLGWVGLVTSIM